MAELRMTLAGQKCENTLYFEQTEPWDITAMGTLADELIGWWGTHYAPNVSDEVSLNEVYITNLSSVDALAIGFTTGLPVTGTQLGDPLPNNVSICVSFRTSNRGRSARGRNYILGLIENDVVSNEVSVQRVNAITAAYALLIGIAAGLNATWVVVSRFHNQAPRAAAVRYLIREVIIVDRTVDSQRRRLPGRGT